MKSEPLGAGPHWALGASDETGLRPAEVPQNIADLPKAKKGDPWIVTVEKVILRLVAYCGKDGNPLYQIWSKGCLPPQPFSGDMATSTGLEAGTHGTMLKWS